jgi:hypothetical protein
MYTKTSLFLDQNGMPVHHTLARVDFAGFKPHNLPGGRI